ncbi:MAG: hypothetical protein F2597_09090 [Actinobacteria bacterium]|uniref:Unannotated protein n=1 Tax=freshwater metagenome TaxID=449393 RepID=A0A6J7NS72_9ZZZZ|nr:hypothetical protein [Actinomycetota bacterium]MSW32159.1 hypothetical protein [Actinomycetota bacterium]MSX34233.1 hypothetical protein [Actinomycetota bacterium]MSX96436.1 hypothetical protein [Actinomycetota bacterium]MSY25088.1 hypothetical protein [Actinomycetota bacterium]
MSETQERRFFVHIGMPKTGSTSIQIYFDQHRDELTRRDIASVPKGMLRMSEVLANELRRLDGRGFDQSVFPETWALEDLLPKWAGHRDCLYSSEMLWSAGPKAVDVLVDLATENDSSVELLAFFRSLDSWMWSWWAQETKAGWIDWCDFLELVIGERRGYLSEVFGSWVRADAEVTIRVRAFEGPDLIQRFAKEVGIEDLEISTSFRSLNVSEPRLEVVRRAALVKMIWNEVVNQMVFKSFPLDYAAGSRLVLETTEGRQVGYESAQEHLRVFPNPETDPTFGRDSLPLLADFVEGWCSDAREFLGHHRAWFDAESIDYLEGMMAQSLTIGQKLRSMSDPELVDRFPQRGFADRLPTSAHEVALARGISAAVVSALGYVDQMRSSSALES